MRGLNLQGKITMSDKLYQKYYTLGVYVDTWGWNEGKISHVFLGLKKEYQLVNENFKGTLSDELKKKYIVESELEQHSKTTQIELINNLTQEYENNETNRAKWTGQTKVFDENYLFFRRGYKDITLPAKQYFKGKTLYHYQAYKDSLAKFIQSNVSNIYDIEGFFGFAPYSSAPLRTSSYGDRERGGKVFQNNHYEYERGENNNTDKEKQSKNSDKNLEDNELSTYSFSKGHILKGIRPLSTFQSEHAYAIKIPNEKYIEVASKVLEDVLISDDDLRGGFSFVSNDNQFRFYALIGRSCVDFVIDKLKILFGNRLNWWDNVTWTPQGAYDVIKKHSKQFNTQETSMLQSLLDIAIFYQNYATLCQIDSTWDCEKGLRAFSTYCYSTLHSSLLDDTKLNRLGEHKIEPLPRDNAIENIADDIAMRINTGLCINAYFQDVLQYDNNLMCDVALLCVKELNGKQRFVKADSQSDFIYQDFDFASDDEIIQKSYNLAMDRQQPIIFAKIPHYNVPHIAKESKGVYIQSFLERYARQDRSIGDYRDILESKETHNA